MFIEPHGYWSAAVLYRIVGVVDEKFEDVDGLSGQHHCLDHVGTLCDRHQHEVAGHYWPSRSGDVSRGDPCVSRLDVAGKDGGRSRARDSSSSWFLCDKPAASGLTLSLVLFRGQG